jgi:hypothetical protein
MGEIAPGEAKMVAYKVTSESHYSVNVDFASGGRTRSNIGYVTNGADFDDVVQITPSGAELRDRNIK